MQEMWRKAVLHTLAHDHSHTNTHAHRHSHVTRTQNRLLWGLVLGGLVLRESETNKECTLPELNGGNV